MLCGLLVKVGGLQMWGSRILVTVRLISFVGLSILSSISTNFIDHVYCPRQTKRYLYLNPKHPSTPHVHDLNEHQS